MPSALTLRALQSIGDSGFAQAKRLASLALVKDENRDSAGKPTAKGYQEAMTYLQPFVNSSNPSESVQAQTILAQYGNSVAGLTSKQVDQEQTVSRFKLQENANYFNSEDTDVGGFRDPASIVRSTAENLSNLQAKVMSAIDQRKSDGQPTESLETYANDLAKRADSMRELNNRLNKGELANGQSLDGYAYVVKNNPNDGSVSAAAVIPMGMGVPGIDTRAVRLNSSVNLSNGALLPVMANANQNSDGSVSANVYGNTWNGASGNKALEPTDGNVFSGQGNFGLSDRKTFPAATPGVKNGEFGYGYTGLNADGTVKSSMFYRGLDGKLYNVDSETAASLSSDPMMKSKLSSAMDLSPVVASSLAKEAVPMQGTTPVGKDLQSVKIAGMQTDANSASAEALKQNSFFGLAKETALGLIPGHIANSGQGGVSGAAVKQLNGLGDAYAKSQPSPVASLIAGPIVGPAIAEANMVVNAVSGAVDAAKSFFGAKNRQNKPDAMPPTQNSPADFTERGKEIFKNQG